MIVNQKAFVFFQTIALILIVLFAYTAFSKFIDFALYRQWMEKLPLVGRGAFMLVWLLPVVEITLAVMLAIPSLQKVGIYASVAFMAGCALYVACMMLGHYTLPCPCGGIFSKLTWPQHLAVNTVLTGIGVGGIYLQKKSKLQKLSDHRTSMSKEFIAQ